MAGWWYLFVLLFVVGTVVYMFLDFICHRHSLASFLGDVLMLEIVGGHGDESLKRLAVFPRLKNLNANCPAITNEGLEQIGRSRSLQMLSLRNTRIDDDGLRHLAGLDNLVVLWLNNTNVTKAGVEKLQEEIPDCDIRYRPGPGPW